MNAKNGSTVFRTRGRLIGCLAALGLALSALVLAPVADAIPAATDYLALGDSLAFGYTQERFEVNYPMESPSFFEEGYVNAFGKLLKAKNKGLTVINDGCPKETSDGLVGHNELLGGEAGPEYDPCPYHFVDQFPLHNGGYYNPETSQPVSQLEEALGTVNGGHPTHEIKAITLDIGYSDQEAAIKKCEEESPAEPALKECVDSTEANVTQPDIIEKIQDILGALDADGYVGPIIVVGYYNADSFVVPGTDALQKGLNKALEEQVIPGFDANVEDNVTFANPFPAFNAGSERSKTEQSKICKYTEMCNLNVQTTEGKNPTSPLYEKDGDPSPSPAGYKAISRLIKKAYEGNPAY